MACKFDGLWFEQTKGLKIEGRDVLLLKPEDVSIDEINCFFGPKQCKNGWKCDLRTSPEVAHKIAQFYSKVMEKSKVKNKQLTLQFVKAVKIESKKITINWASYATCLVDLRSS